MQKFDWKTLPFMYQKTNYNVRCYYRNETWGQIEVSSSEYINLHIAATTLHYGQEAFEGLKAFQGKDGKVRVFRWQENLKRLQNSARAILMPEVPEQLFKDIMIKAIRLNKEFIPPYDSGASLYIRPLLIGTGAQIGVKPANEYLFLILVTPVGPYFKEGFKPSDLVITRNFDRSAPFGTGNVKVGGNYAAGLKAGEDAHKDGYSAALYLDPKEKKYIDECGPANFFAIKNNTYITPKSTSILPSITNKSLMTLAEDIGLKVEVRPVDVEELNTFEEVGACGTATVISPVKKIVDPDKNKEYKYCKDGEPGQISQKLYKLLTDIQYGNEHDKFNWIEIIEI